MLLLSAPKKSALDLLREAQERLCADVAWFQQNMAGPNTNGVPQRLTNFPIQGYAAELLATLPADGTLVTGFDSLDALFKELPTGGLRPGEFVLIAVGSARPKKAAGSYHAAKPKP